MSIKLQPARGTHDILPEESARRKEIIKKAERVFALYGYEEIATPIFEFSEVFHRSLGDSSDVVNKETYSFTDRGGESLTLRPEFTAGIVRAFISNGLQENLPFKVFYHGAAFRYERPQKGRMRQFHQLGAELLGAGDDALYDVEIIAMAAQLLSACGLIDFVKLEINSLGDQESRNKYRAALVSYMNDNRNNLSEESRIRLEKNPLRILDSKDENDRKIIAASPVLGEYLTAQCADFYSAVKSSLAALNINFVENHQLVRGLDYYSHTVFEFTTDQLGAQGTILAGGRYDGLVKLLGGNDISGVGFAAGIERLLALSEAVNIPLNSAKQQRVAVIPVDSAQIHAALILTNHLRQQGISTELITRGNVGKKMKRAEKAAVSHVVLLGEEEIATNQLTVRDMQNGTQEKISRDFIVDKLQGKNRPAENNT